MAKKTARKEVKRAKPKKQKKKAKKTEYILARGKRKKAVARAVVKEGKGRIYINKMNIDALGNRYYVEFLKEPLSMFADKINKLDVKINVKGGGVMGQLQAARRALVVGIANFLGEKKLLEGIKKENKYLVVEDPRRVEPKKYKGRKARARFQKSYR